MTKNIFQATYQRLLGRKFFNKILMTYILVVVVSLLALSFAISQSVTSKLQEEYSNYNRQAIYALQEYILGKVDTVNAIVTQIYDDEQVYEQVFGLLEAPDSAAYIWNNRAELAGVLGALADRDPDIHDLVFYKVSPEMSWLYLKEAAALDPYPQIVKPYYQLRYHFEGKKFVSRHPGIGAGQEGTYTIGMINNLVYPVTGEKTSKIMVNFDFAALAQVYGSYAEYVKGYIMILTDDGTVVFDSSGTYYDKQYPYFDEIKQSGGFLTLDEESFVDVIKVGEYGVTCISVIPQFEFTRNIRSLRITTFLISLLCILAIIVIYYFSTRIFSRRVDTVIDVMKKVADNDLAPRIPVKGEEDEIGMISTIFNRMCDNLQEYIEKVYITEIKQRRMELKALQAQVNPHFLYNTLEAIRMGLNDEGNEASAEMIYNLAELFRISLRSETIVSLKDELEYCRIYLELFSIRYGDKLKYSFEVPDEIGEYGVIKRFLQPLVENFIVHGFTWDKEANCVIIKACVQDQDLLITVSDNGSGIREDKLAAIQTELDRYELNANDGIGLKNVNDRIKLVYGRQYGLSISSTPGQGTEISILIPRKTKEELKKIIQIA